MMEPIPDNAPRPSPELRRVAFHAVASGLTPLIPVPLLDDLALRRVRERMVRDLLRAHRLDAPDETVETLAGSHQSAAIGGRVLGTLRSVALFPVKKVFRKIFFVLWIKDCVDMASGSLHQGFLLQHALARGDLSAQRLGRDQAQRVHAAITAACEDVDPRPVNQTIRRLFASSRLLLAEASRAFANPKQVAARTRGEDETEEVQSLADRLVAALWEERGYFKALAQRYDAHYDPVSSA